jgi:hypothetical protein
MTPNRALLLPARLAERGDLSLEFPREPEELAFETSQPGLCESLIHITYSPSEGAPFRLSGANSVNWSIPQPLGQFGFVSQKQGPRGTCAPGGGNTCEGASTRNTNRSQIESWREWSYRRFSA